MDSNILIIKLSAIGDFVQATGAIAAIRAHHPKARITLMTTAPMKTLAATNPNVDDIIYHVKPKWWQWRKFANLKKQFQGFSRIYDLQCSGRTATYFKVSGKPKGWCGHAIGCDFHQNPQIRAGRHSGDFLPEQLAIAGIQKTPAPDICYAAESATEKLTAKNLLKNGEYPKNLVVLIPGSSASWPGKRWPHYAALSKELQARGRSVWLCGGPDEAALLEEISAASGAPNLLGLRLSECLSVFQNADHVIGNDTGPTHMAAAVKSKVTVLFGPSSNYKRHAPRGAHVTVLNHAEDIKNINIIKVLETLSDD